MRTLFWSHGLGIFAAKFYKFWGIGVFSQTFSTVNGRYFFSLPLLRGSELLLAQNWEGT